jgi:hypothetical protein
MAPRARKGVFTFYDEFWATSTETVRSAQIGLQWWGLLFSFTFLSPERGVFSGVEVMIIFWCGDSCSLRFIFI